MFLKKDKRPNGRLYLSIVKGYRDTKTKRNKQKAIKSIGFYDELINEYNDPISHFTEVARQMTENENANNQIKITINTNELMDTKTDDIKNIGFLALSKIYHELALHKFLINRERAIRAKYPLNNIMKLLVFDRILHPSSKLASYENKDMYLENFDFPLEDVYRALTYFAKYKDKMLLELHENIRMLYGRDTENFFYDVTNYYLHTGDETELIANGYGKDRRGKPIIQMGLLLDNNALPITYKLFKGNTTDFETLIPILQEVKKKYNLNRAIVVADKGLNSGSNKAYNIINGDGYIFSRSLRGTKADKEVKRYALDEKGYKWLNDEYKIKSRVYPTDIWVENEEGKKVEVQIDEKHIVFYSEKYARRTKHQRNKLISKAIELINSPSRYAKTENYGSLKYIQGMNLNKQTGKLTVAKKDIIPKLNENLIREEEKYDGYYSLVTSELDMLDTEVIERYRGLWKIEETFKVTKTNLETRPIYLKKNEHIEAHFLSCFISLLILRILEMKTKRKYPVGKIIKSLKKSNVCLLDMNQYKGVYYDEILEEIDKSIGSNLSRKYLILEDIKKMLADSKKKEKCRKS